jgi:acyl-CoA synthetase (NDP forming)
VPKELTKTQGQESLATIKTILDAAVAQNRNLLEPESYRILEAMGLHMPAYRYVETKKDLGQAFEQLGSPLVMKIMSPDILHKSDVGGVQLNLTTLADCHSTWNRFEKIAQDLDANFQGALLVAQQKAGPEFIVGAMRDEEFGPVAMVGPGGILVEILKSPTFFLAPVDPDHVLSVVSEGIVGTIMKGVRGGSPLDQDFLAKIVADISWLIYTFPEIKEIDLNPIVGYSFGGAILDARIMLL